MRSSITLQRSLYISGILIFSAYFFSAPQGGNAQAPAPTVDTVQMCAESSEILAELEALKEQIQNAETVEEIQELNQIFLSLETHNGSDINAAQQANDFERRQARLIEVIDKTTEEDAAKGGRYAEELAVLRARTENAQDYTELGFIDSDLQIIRQKLGLSGGGGQASSGGGTPSTSSTGGGQSGVGSNTSGGIPTPGIAKVPDGYTLRWNDEFDSLSLGNTSSYRWTPYDTLSERAGYDSKGRILTSNSSDAIWLADYETNAIGNRTYGEAFASTGLYGQGPFFHEVSGGTLKMRAYPVPESIRNEFVAFGHPNGAPYAAGGLFSPYTTTQQYGYYEVRLKVNNITKGQHFALWLLQDDLAWPPEIDMLEVIGENPQYYHTTVHGEGPNGTDPTNSFHIIPDEGSDDWHTIGFLWTETEMRFYVDGNEYEQKENYGQGAPIGVQPNFVNKPMYMLMTWEMASYWPGDPDQSTKWPAEVEIDYVRIYK